MEITETRVKLIGGRNNRLKAFCSVTFDNDFVIRDIKVIEGTSGYFVAMPSRKLTDRCPSCGNKNALQARYCCDCGTGLGDSRANQRSSRTLKLHADIAHPVNTETRQYIQNKVVEAFHQEVEHSKQPDYEPPRLDHDDDYEMESVAPPEDSAAVTSDAPVNEPSPAPLPADGSDTDFSKGIFD